MAVETYFDNINSKICEKIDSVKYNLCIAVTWLTEPAILKALINKAKEEIHIDLIIDNNEINNNHLSQYAELVKNGINLYFYTQNMMHNKFAIFDLREVVTGSYNYTKGASYNNENIVVIKDENTVDRFVNEFKKIKSLSTSYADFSKIIEEKDDFIIAQKDFLFNSIEENEEELLAQYYSSVRNNLGLLYSFQKEEVHLFELLLFNYFNKNMHWQSFNDSNTSNEIRIDNEYRIKYIRDHEFINTQLQKIDTLNILIHDSDSSFFKTIYREIDYENSLSMDLYELPGLIRKTSYFKNIKFINIFCINDRVRKEFIEMTNEDFIGELFPYFKEAQENGIEVIVQPDNIGLDLAYLLNRKLN